MTSPNSAAAGKKDLHFGGVGSEPGVALATMSTDGYIRKNPWAAIGAISLIGLAAGYFLSRRI